ncbi:CPBP family intramembrane metalloprotease [Lysobacter sp. A6]|uniref:CPBP family intramembrane metalloprotease n=1 Tax=Noviluteimonas lactosilytica TaxID=2888523 RepID=A0ABS8JEH3_9GAMM|nr:CPBP family intramembrane glutamic endopeptidase [Lysobacter lactosilyticus]MCC8361888.1 CPBP family intramembrane metalloprotease [Lysobacter lactosilyticus]
MRMGKVAACLLALWVGGACAADRPDAEAAAGAVQAGKVAAYRDALSRFDAAQAAAPGDASIGVARCDFISRYTDSEYDWVESAPADYEACTQMLAKRWPASPDVALFELGNDWDGDALEKGEALLDAAKAWPKPQQAQLYASLAEHAEEDDKGDYALRAVELGDATQTAEAVTHLAGKQEYAKAQALLERTPPDDLDWRATRRVKAAMLLPDTQAAQREVERHARAGVEVYQDARVRALLRAGKPQAAQAAMANAPAQAASWRALRFDVAVAAKDWPTALAQVEQETEDFGTRLQRFVKLAGAHPASMAQPTMLGTAIVLLMVAMAMALAMGLVFVPVHYRGLARRLQHRASKSPFPRVTLWHTWYGVATIVVVQTFAALMLAPELLDGGELRGATMMRLASWSMIGSALFLLPMVPVFDRRALLGDRAIWRGTWKSIVGWWLVLLAITTVLGALYAGMDADTSTEQVRMVAAMADEARDAGGVLVTFGVIALLGPMVEEFVFRGLLLGGLSRHLDFKWANGIQAVAFACLHMDPPRFVFYLVMGLACGWLARRTGSVAPAFALHALNNAWAIGMMMAM